MGELDVTLPEEDLGTARTVAVEAPATAEVLSAPGATSTKSALARVRTADRTTVLPRLDGALEAGALVDGQLPRFEPLQSLGVGGMGEVALARDQDIGRHVAIKRLLPGLGADSLERFAREVRIVGRLEHPGIVPVHDVGVDGAGRHYFVMKYVEGETLETIIEKLRQDDPLYRARYTPGRRVELFHELLQALRYAHARGVIHRDIKPSNVMVGAFGEVLLMDWGIAKEIGAADRPIDVAPPAGAADDPRAAFRTRHGSLIGTPAYMAPEQARGDNRRLDVRTDVYALSVLLHELLTLHHYLEGKSTIEEIVWAVGNDEEQGFFELLEAASREGVGAEYVHLLRRGLKKRPEERYQSIDEMIEELDGIRDHRVKVQCHVTFARRVSGELTRRVDRHPMLATLLAMLAIGIFATGLVALVGAAIRLAGG